mmetsp:Transcript_9954/g.9676  ORF Transcript_9954/g.9676 Transcript_9954/m.9676 type:complete len:132 (+) Transcript_9954:192-587(+)
MGDVGEIRNQRTDALVYLEKHKILLMFDILGVKLAQQKPSSPNDFILSELQDMVEAKAKNEQVSIFTDADIDNIFGIFDITNRGYLDATQLEKALAAVGIKEAKGTLPTLRQIDRQTFSAFISEEVKANSF